MRIERNRFGTLVTTQCRVCRQYFPTAGKDALILRRATEDEHGNITSEWCCVLCGNIEVMHTEVNIRMDKNKRGGIK